MNNNHVGAGMLFIAICAGIGVLGAIASRPAQIANQQAAVAAPSAGVDDNLLIAENAEEQPPAFGEVQIKASEPTQASPLPELTSAWLIGTWANADHNPQNDPNASCDTDNVIEFAVGGRYSDGASEGRYRAGPGTIAYLDRQSVQDLGADPAEPFAPERMPDMATHVRVIDQNTFEEDGARWRRCRSG